MSNLRLRPISEQVIVITGASSGIGLVTAKAAAAQGARVIMVSRNADAMAKIVTEIEVTGGTAAYAVADVGAADQVRAAADVAIATFGRIDTWINAAGVAIYASLVDTPLDEHQHLFQTNYFGVVNGSTAAIEHLQEDGGALITVGSIAGDMPSPVMGAYSASKHAVKGYIESLRLELAAASPQISVTLIKPSGIDTPIAEHAANHTGGTAKIPPPVYDPAIVSAAILDAAQNGRRTVTVGGIGRLQVLFANHFPGLFALTGWVTEALLVDYAGSETYIDNLKSPSDDGSDRSAAAHGRRFSIYTTVNRHRAFATLALTGAAATVLAIRRRGNSRLSETAKTSVSRR